MTKTQPAKQLDPKQGIHVQNKNNIVKAILINRLQVHLRVILHYTFLQEQNKLCIQILYVIYRFSTVTVRRATATPQGDWVQARQLLHIQM